MNWHGTLSGYTHKRCRCGECREANRAYTEARRAERRQAPPPAGVVHGVHAYRNWGCRCTVCRDGQRRWFAEYRSRAVAS